MLDNTQFAASFATDAAPWASNPGWYLVAGGDRVIPPPAQRAMSRRARTGVVEVRGSHAIYVSQPEVVADLIKKAVNGLSAT